MEYNYPTWQETQASTLAPTFTPRGTWKNLQFIFVEIRQTSLTQPTNLQG